MQRSPDPAGRARFVGLPCPLHRRPLDQRHEGVDLRVVLLDASENLRRQLARRDRPGAEREQRLVRRAESGIEPPPLGGSTTHAKKHRRGRRLQKRSSMHW